MRIFEVDQPAVQALKRAKLASIEDLPSRFINFVPVDFTTQSLEAELLKSGFDPKAPTVATMEGLTQYIPKSSTEATLQVLNKLCSTKGSVLGVSYVVQDVQDALGSSWGVNGERFGMLLSRVNAVGEPWIASWEPSDFERMLRERGGFEVKEETAQMALAKKYLKPLGRMVPAESKCEVERYVTAVRMEFGLETRRAQIYAENKVMRQHEKKQFAEFKRAKEAEEAASREASPTKEGAPSSSSGPDVEAPAAVSPSKSEVKPSLALAALGVMSEAKGTSQDDFKRRWIKTHQDSATVVNIASVHIYSRLMASASSANLESHDDLEFVGQRTREQRDEEGRRRAIDVDSDTVNEEYFQQQKELRGAAPPAHGSRKSGT